MKLVLFGTSNMLSDIFDCALALGIRPSLVVTNVEEVVRPRTKSVAERVAALDSPPELISLDAFEPGPDECYFLGTTAPGREHLVHHLVQRFSLSFTRLVHPRASVSPLASLAEGVFVGAGSVVGPGATLDRHVFVSRGVTIGHDTVVEPFCRLMPGCNVGGHVWIGAGATIGMGANVLQELQIGAGSLLAIGATVLRDVPPCHVVAGSPARLVRRVDADSDLAS